ncbi:spore protease YyaC [Gorillibacterium sp. sgz5001074]|uniref:spore protease YyaC n=1 Tax=Gorillibacterium sp. sgz5001074 TaxID=3446695 RepID=UPI003F666B88
MKLFTDPRSTSDKPSSFKIQHTEPHCASAIANYLTAIFRQIPSYQELVFVCIGTDRSTGDSLGPIIGSRLMKYNISDIRVYGTLDQPVHAMNLEETIKQIHETYYNPYIVGIDACLGQVSSVGCVQIGNGPLKPGAGVKKELPSVGDIHLTGVVNVGGFMEYFVLQNTRLSLVMNMADIIAKGIYISLLQTKRMAYMAPKQEPATAWQPQFEL